MIEAVLRVAKLAEVKTKVNIVHEDLADNKSFGCALDGDAECVVSGDEHISRIERYQSVRILSVRQFFKLLEETKSHSSDNQVGFENWIFYSLLIVKYESVY